NDGLGAFHQLGDAAPAFVGACPSVIDVGERAAATKPAMPLAEQRATVWTAVLKGMNLASVSEQHNVLTQNFERPGLATEPPAGQHRVPVIAQPRFGQRSPGIDIRSRRWRGCERVHTSLRDHADGIPAPRFTGIWGV